MRGRKSKPTAQKKLAGNPGKRKLNNEEPQYSELTQAEPPEWLDDIAREVWEWYAPRLLASHVLSDVDLHNLEAFCAAYSRWRKAEEEVARSGITIPTAKEGIQKNPAITVIAESLKQINTFGAALGLDPASRTRIKAPGGQRKNAFKALD